MTSSVFNRTRRSAAAAGSLTVIPVAGGALVLAVGSGVPQGWWPNTGQAFAADAHPAEQDGCALTMGPAKEYCERGATMTACAGQPGVAGAAWQLVPAGAGVVALGMWRCRGAAGQGRR